MIERVRPSLATVRSGRSARRLAIHSSLNRDAPKRLVQVLIRQAQKKVSKATGIQDVGVEQRRQSVHRLLQAEFLILGSQLVQRISATRLRIPTIGENVFSPHTPM